jgi:hypothetical protein
MKEGDKIAIHCLWQLLVVVSGAYVPHYVLYVHSIDC